MARKNAPDALSGANAPAPVSSGHPDVCARCGASFAKTRSWHRFCSDRCRRDNNGYKDILARLGRIEAKLDGLTKGGDR